VWRVPLSGESIHLQPPPPIYALFINFHVINVFPVRVELTTSCKMDLSWLPLMEASSP
jgi:hypothetical protein